MAKCKECGAKMGSTIHHYKGEGLTKIKTILGRSDEHGIICSQCWPKLVGSEACPACNSELSWKIDKGKWVADTITSADRTFCPACVESHGRLYKSYVHLKTGITKLKQLIDDDLITKEQHEDGVLKITKENTPIDLSLDGVRSYLTLIKDLERESLIDSDMYKKISDHILTDLNYDVTLKHTNVSNDPNTFKEDKKKNDFKEASVKEVAETLISDTSGEKSLIKPVLLTVAFGILVTLLIGIIKESMPPGFPRAIIIIVCFLSIYKFWGWVKN